MSKKTSFFQNFRTQHHLLFHLSIMVSIIAALAVLSHVVMHFGTRHGAHCRVPDFSGIPLDQAQRIAQKNDLRLQINDSLFVPAYEGGIVLDQLPQGGVDVKPGRTVYITINSFREKMVPVPFVAGYSLRQAKNMLEIAGLEIERLDYQPDIATNYVLEEYCGETPIWKDTKMEAEMGSGVWLVVGVTEDQNITVVPMTVGLPLKAAKSQLWEAGLNIGEIKYDEGINLLNQKNARVYIQTPVAGSRQDLGTNVSLRLTLEQKTINKHKEIAEKQALELEKQALEEEKLRDQQAQEDEVRESQEPIEPAQQNITSDDEFF